MRLMQAYITALSIASFFPTLTSQTYNSNLFTYPTSLLSLVTTPNGTHQYQYPNGTPVNVGASSSFNPFDDLVLAEGYSVHLLGSTELTLYVPILFTAAVFETFYRTVFEYAASELWAAFRPSKRVSISVGQMQLVFQTTGSAPIPWHVVAAFAWNMWQAARRGFTAGYALDIVGGDGGGVTTVMLMAGNREENGVQQDYADTDGTDCDCSMTEFSELTTEENLDDYIDEFCKRHCRRGDRMRIRRRGRRWE